MQCISMWRQCISMWLGCFHVVGQMLMGRESQVLFPTALGGVLMALRVRLSMQGRVVKPASAGWADRVRQGQSMVLVQPMAPMHPVFDAPVLQPDLVTDRTADRKLHQALAALR